MTEHLTLPKTWQNVPLSECLEINQSGTWGNEPRGDETDVPVLRSTNIQDGQMVLDDLAYRSVNPTVIPRFALAEGDILITKSSGSPQLIGKNIMFVPPDDEKTYLFSNFTQRIRSNQRILVPEYLYYFLNSQFAHHFLQRIQSTTSGLRNLDMNLYVSQPIPLPPLSEQHRVAAILREAIVLARERYKADARAKKLYASVFYEMFGTGIPTAKHPQTVKLEKILAIPLASGYSPVTSDVPPGIPVFTLSAITGFGLDETRIKFYQDEAYKGKGSDLLPDDILITRSNTEELVGKVDRYQGKPNPVIYPDLMIRIRLRDKRDSPYVENYLRSQYMQMIVRRLSRGTSSSMKKISQGDIYAFDILWPPDIERHRYADWVARIDEMRKEQKAATGKIEALYQSLLARAFTGELTAAWREAHSELLRDETVQRDIVLGLRGAEPTLGDLDAGRVTKAEQEEANRQLAQALEQFRAIPSTVFQGLFTETFGDAPTISIDTILSPQSEMLDTLRAETSQLFAEQLRPVAQVLAQRLAQYTEGLVQLQAEALRQPMLQVAPELTRQLATWFSGVGRLGELAQALAARKPLREALGSDIAALLDAISAAPAYFRAEMLINDEISLIQAEEGLRLLGALGIVRPVHVRGQAGYRLVSREREQAIPEGLGL